MIKFIKKLLGISEVGSLVERSKAEPIEIIQTVEILPPKDPKDLSLTPSSTPWVNQKHWCKSCKTNRTHQEYMADTCNGCGSYYKIDLYGCNIRKIWAGEKWMYQYNERGNNSWLGEIKE